MRKTTTYISRALALTLALTAAVACDRTGNINEDTPVSGADVVDFDQILLDDAADAAAAAQVGDPATLLGAAQEAHTTIRGHMTDVFGFIKRVVESDPAETGLTAEDRPYALWTGSRDGVDLRFAVVRVNERRVRYLLQAKRSDGEEFKNLLTGIFVRRGEQRGGGRLHMNLGNISDVRGGDTDGSLQVAFANGRDDKQGRRVVYRNLTNRNDPNAEPQSFGADLIRIVGEGGRFRTLHLGNLLEDVPGLEALGLRVLWKADQGGRADAVIARIAPRPVVVLGHAHECFDAEGLRTGYADTFEDNDAIDPNEGDVRNCLGFAEEEVPDAAVDNGFDEDPELDELLEEDGANEVSEDDAEEEVAI